MNEGINRDRLREEVYRLTEACLRGEATPGELARLEECLNRSSDGLDHYLEYVAQSAALGIWATALADSDADDRSRNSIVPLDSISPGTQSHGIPLSLGSDPLSPSPLGQGSTESQPSNWLFGASGFVLPALFAVAAFAVLLAFLFTQPPSSPVDQPDKTVAKATTDLSPAAVPVVLAPLEVRSIRLDFGTTRLSLPKVGYIVIEGPAELDLLGPMRARLNSGRIKMRVTEASGRGFVVETPYGEITDLGTEFGIGLTELGQAGLVVFEGAVDLRVAEASAVEGSRVERFVGGEGVVFNKVGQVNRLSSIFTGNAATFLRQNEVPAEKITPSPSQQSLPLITAADDNLGSAETKKFYAIVPGGLRDDARAYADAIHEWNGITSAGIPSYLVGADYVRTFNQYSIRKKLGVCITLSRPAKLYVFLDARSSPPDWLEATFRNTGDRIGLDAGPYSQRPKRTVTVGAGQSIDEEFTIWEREVREPGVVRLGTNMGATVVERGPAMYGIAAVPLDSADSSEQP